jgi:hypothetical protein
MKEFFLILLFAKSIVITAEPIDIRNSVSLSMAEPVSAITSGAHVRIDVTNSLVGTTDFSNIVSVLDHLKMQFPVGSVVAILTTTTGEKMILDKVSGSTNGENAELVLSSSSGLPTGIEFSELKIESSIELLGVTIIWQNYSK